ncbi:aminoglycoside phosphotransferase family protein [Lachnoclostridium phytofermentans]|uniref:aminoglycoside phosphotransferase family protein n=1 Tax=Lachnoclostridium phytofermentans TaxID=66219 RepID=UPI000495BBDA|nr:aminoglycoside phosphotransferase family protein [Lachnoclostridium phytofermentans]
MEKILGKQVGSGGTSNVYEWGDTEVIKIYKPHIEDNVIDNEMHIGQLLNRFLLNIPKYMGSIDYYGKRALIYERICGKIMAEPLLAGIYETELAYKFAQMHYDIHNKSLDELPSQYDFLKRRILELKSILGNKAAPLINLLDNIPSDNKLCHGDYQPLNIIGEDNKYIVIDWNGACSGNPILDVAWSYMTLNSPIIKLLLGAFVSEIFANFAKDYLSYYCNLSGITQEHILMCLPIVASRRLYDNIMCDNDNSRQEREWLFRLIEKT